MAVSESDSVEVVSVVVVEVESLDVELLMQILRGLALKLTKFENPKLGGGVG